MVLEKEKIQWKRSEEEDPDRRELDKQNPLAHPTSNARQGYSNDGNHSYLNV